MRKLLWYSAVLAAGVAVALISGHFALEKHPQTLHGVAQWKDVYRTTSGLVAGADLIVEAEHLAAEAGRMVGEGGDATPFTNNTFAVVEILKGEHNGTEFVVEQTGGILPGGEVFDINDGGPYKQGQRYLLFLKDRGDGIYYAINHQARYEIVDGILQGVDPTDRVVAQVHGWPLDVVRDPIRERAKLFK